MHDVIELLRKTAMTGAGVTRGGHRLAAALMNRGKIIKVKTNVYKTHPKLLKFTEWPFLHAESHCIISHGIDNCEGLDLVVVRTLKDGTLNMAKPCEICTALMKEAGIKRVYYTDWEGRLVSSMVD